MGDQQGSTSPTYIIDGYNVIRGDTQLRAKEDEHGLEEGRKTLLNQLVDSRQLAKTRVIVVFDGRGEAYPRTASPRSGLDVVFSVSPQNADKKIVSILKARHDDTAMTVVTADLDLQWEVKKLGARVVDPGDFIKSKFAARKRPRRESTEPITTAEDLAWGLKTFGDGIIKIEAAVKTPSPTQPKGRAANVDERNQAKERNRKRYLRQNARKR